MAVLWRLTTPNQPSLCAALLSAHSHTKTDFLGRNCAGALSSNVMSCNLVAPRRACEISHRTAELADRASGLPAHESTREFLQTAGRFRAGDS